MKLNPEVERVLRQMAASGAPPLEQLPTADARHFYEQLSVMLGGPVVEMLSVEDLTSATGAAIPVRLYRPASLTAGAAPLVVYLHGGGWVVGSLQSHDKVCRRMADLSGCAVLTVEYRLAPEHPMPSGADDVLEVLRWVVRDAGMLGIDTERLAIAGDSAGGGLAAMACLALRASEVKLRAQVLFYPSTDNTPSAWTRFPSRVQNAGVAPLTSELMKHWTALFLGDSSDAQDWRISPLLAGDHRDLPPALIFTAEYDTLRDDGRVYGDVLKAAGNRVEHLELPGMIHGFIEMPGALPSTAWTMERAAAFIRNHLDLPPQTEIRD